MDLLQHSESLADPPDKLEFIARKIRKDCQVLSSEVIKPLSSFALCTFRDRVFFKAYFLEFLNCLRLRDFSGAVEAVNLGVNPEASARKATLTNQVSFSGQFYAQ